MARNVKHNRCVDCGRPIYHQNTRCRQCNDAHKVANRKWPRERVIKAIQEWADKHGKPPSGKDWERSGHDHPARSSIYGRGTTPFRSWNEAIRAAGFEPINRGTRRIWDREHAAQLREQGLNDVQIAELLGVHPQTIRHGLGPREKALAAVAKRRKRRSREERIADLRKALSKTTKGERL